MVKKQTKVPISKVDRESEIINENGKRPADDQNKEGKKRIKVKNLFRQPTVNELNRLQETENLFNSNLFRLQVEEILQEVKVKEKTEKKFQQWFSEFKTFLNTIPEDNIEYDLSEQTLVKKLKVKLPINEKLNKTKCMFKFCKFSQVDLVGSYATGCAINAKLRVDIQITVPAATYTKNDSINYRYHKKRAAYLAYITSHLTKLNSIEELKYTWLNGSEIKPVLDIKPEGKLGNHFTVRLYLSCEAEAYKLHRFSPTRNNLRETCLFGGESQESSSDVGPPTPYYNSTVLSDLTAISNEEYLKNTLINSENLKQAIVLLKIWLRQRNLQVSGHVISLYVAYLVQMKRINNIMSSYQIVRNVWIALRTSEWDTKGISLHKSEDLPALSEFLSHFPVVFLDTTGYYNLAWNMTKGTYDALKRECDLAVQMLDNTNLNSFIPLFMVPVKPLMQFDHILRFKNMQNITESIISRASKEAKLNYGIDQLALVTNALHSLLTKGLGDRVELILQMVDTDFSWSVKKSPGKAKENAGFEQKLSFGFILNPENAFNIVLKGPPANLPDAEEFRAFWGDKSELRRFQDGAITETCVWEGDSNTERRSVPKQIIDYLLALKYDIQPSQLFHIFDQCDSVTAMTQLSASSEESSVEVIRAFDDLRRDLRALTQLPLDISAVYGVSPVFSYSAVAPPQPRGAVHKPWRRGHACLIKDGDDSSLLVPYTPVSKAIIELGHSGKWPGEIEAFRCLKAAFHLQISERLLKQYSLPTQAYATHVDVLKNGLVFRLQIAHPKEITLLRREMQNGVAKYRETPESIALHTDTVLMPRLRGALHGLHQKHPSFGPTACLFKRWLSAHLLSPPHFPGALAELLAAALFVHSEPLRPPHSPTAGLARVLNKLAHTDWKTEMIILDFNEDMKREEIAELEQKFNSDRESMPPLCIVTAYDGAAPAAWSRAAPSPPALARAQALARAALAYLDAALLTDTREDVLPMFVPSLAGYDALIQLSARGGAGGGTARGGEADDVIPVVEFDPVQRYLDELRSAFGEWAVFFHDAYGGDVIAVLWTPEVNDTKEFLLSNANALTPFKDGGETKYRVDTAAILEDFKTMGAGLVKDVTICT